MSKKPWRTTRRDLLFFAIGGVSAGVATYCLTRLGGEGALREKLLSNPGFLLDNPDILEATGTIAEARRMEADTAVRKDMIRTKWQPLLHVAFAPSIGPADAPLLLIEFTDYTCAPCRASAPAVRTVLDKHEELRAAMMFYPTGGAIAEYAARFAVACYRSYPGKFPGFHEKLMEEPGRISQGMIEAVADASGYEVERLREEMSHPGILGHLKQVRLFAEDMRLSGVPMFMMASGRMLLGGVTEAELDALIKQERETS